VRKDKALPRVAPAVDANFMAQVETLILTAGHDDDKLLGPIVIDVSREGDQMTQMDGAARAIRAGDVIIRDTEGSAARSSTARTSSTASSAGSRSICAWCRRRSRWNTIGGLPPDAQTARYACRTCSSARNAAIEPW
jgi:hypothetical protein